MNHCNNFDICVVGLGYVGYPLYNKLSSKFRCFGVDTNPLRIQELTDLLPLSSSKNISSGWVSVTLCNVYIVAVPTPIDSNLHPDTSALEDACVSIGKLLSKGDVVIFESTVYPGTTEEICKPILELNSGLNAVEDFGLGYSPERINIGDKEHCLDNTKKIISASDSKTLEIMEEIYSSIISAELIKTSSIKVAEAAKLYENTQRDVLIALANQYSDFCKKENLDIREVTRCASSKWNFASVYPGLVGGHCIGVDPYYLIDRSEKDGLDMSLVKTARSINEHKALQVAIRIVDNTKIYGKDVSESSVILLGFSYKANTSDIRNTKVFDVYRYLKTAFKQVVCYDPLVNERDVKQQYGITVLNRLPINNHFDIAVRLVKHKVFEKDIISADLLLDLDNLL